MNIRVKELTALLDEVCDLDIILPKIGLKKDILFARSKIIVSGMSFGGTAAV